MSSIYNNDLESQQHGGSESDEEQDALPTDYDPQDVYLIHTRLSLGLSIKDISFPGWKQAAKDMGLPFPPVLADNTPRTYGALNKDNLDKIVGGYMSQKKSKNNPDRVEAERIEEVLVDGEWKKRAKAEVDIDIQSDAALTFCPDEDEEDLKKVILVMLKVMKPRSTNGLEGEDLVKAENANADRSRSLKALIKCLNAVDETNEVTHVYKYFTQIIAGYDDGKDEAELRELQEELEIIEADVKENETRIGQAKAANNSKKEKRERGKRQDNLKDLEKIKAKIMALTERIARKNRSSQNRSVTPSRKRSRDGASPTEDESPEKKLRITEKRFPLSSPDDVRHSLKDYFNNTDEDLTFTCGKEGFEPDEGKWTEDARKKLSFLEEEVTA